MATTTPPATININILNYNAAKKKEKLDAEALTADPVTHLKQITPRYLTNGTEALIKANLEACMEEAEENEVVKAGSPNILRLHDVAGNEIEWSYYTHDATATTDGKILGIFLDYTATDKLMNNTKTYPAFKSWFQKVVTDFFKAEGLIVEAILNVADVGDKFHVEFPVKAAV